MRLYLIPCLILILVLWNNNVNAQKSWTETSLLNHSQKIDLMRQLDMLIYLLYEQNLPSTKNTLPPDDYMIESFTKAFGSNEKRQFDDITPNFENDQMVVVETLKTPEELLIESQGYFNQVKKKEIVLVSIDVWNALNSERVKITDLGIGSTYLIQERSITYTLQNGKVIKNHPTVLIMLNFDIIDQKIENLRISEIVKQESQYYYPHTNEYILKFGTGSNLNLSSPSFPDVNDISRISPVDISRRGSISIHASLVHKTGLSIGLALNRLSGSLSLDEYSAAFVSTDVDGEEFIKNIIVTDIQEDFRLDFLSVPLRYNHELKFLNNGSWTISGFIGVTPSLILKSSSLEAIGTFTYTGFYPQFGSIIDGVERLGFFNSLVEKIETDDIEINRFNAGIEFGAFGTYKPKIKGWHFEIGLAYSMGLLNISKSHSDQRLSSGRGEYHGLLPLSTDFRPNNLAITIGAFWRIDRKNLKTIRLR